MPIVKVDLTEAGEGSEFQSRHVAEGEYRFQIKTSKVVQVKNGPNKGKDQLVFTLVSPQIRGASYPYYVAIFGAAAWKLRQLCESAGVPIKSGAIGNFNSDKLHGKFIGAVMEDREYEDKNTGETKLSSQISQVFSANDLEDGPVSSDNASVDEEDESASKPAPEVTATPDIDLDDI